jgi:hypothetical protein
MANQIRPLAQLFRAMADLIDQDHTSQTRYAAIAKAAEVVAARATAEQLVARRLWQVDGAELLALAYAFHAGLPRQAATAAHVQAMQAGSGPAGPGATSTASCDGAPNGADWWSSSGWPWPAPPSCAAGWSVAHGPATAGTADPAVGPDPH